MDTPPDDPPPRKDDADSAPPERSGLSTPVLVAMLSLGGVLGGSLLTNWDKVFGGKARAPAAAAAAPAAAPAAASATVSNSGAQSPVLHGVSGPVTINYGAAPPTAAADASVIAQLQGVWLSEVMPHPYQRDRKFRLRLELRPLGKELHGQVADIAEGAGGTGTAVELPVLKPSSEGLDFQIESTWCCEAGQQRPYQVFYQLRPMPQGQLSVTRRNNAPGGGQVERFTMSRPG